MTTSEATAVTVHQADLWVTLLTAVAVVVHRTLAKQVTVVAAVEVRLDGLVVLVSRVKDTTVVAQLATVVAVVAVVLVLALAAQERRVEAVAQEQSILGRVRVLLMLAVGVVSVLVVVVVLVAVKQSIWAAAEMVTLATQVAHRSATQVVSFFVGSPQTQQV
jgi:hypothetical protein